MIITIIAAVSKNNVIGKDGRLPWRLRTDMRKFKEKTMGHPIVMGRKTYESIGKPLPSRTNVVLTRQEMEIDGCIVVGCIDIVLEKFKNHDEIFVIGGEEVYRSFLGITQRLMITRVAALIEGGIKFPKVTWDQWRLTSYEYCPKGDGDDYDFAFTEYLRK